MTKYTKEFIDSVLDDIKKGSSMNSLSKKHSIPISVIQRWCEKQGIKSSFATFHERATRDEILAFIYKSDASTADSISRYFGYTHRNTLHTRLSKMALKGTLKRIIFPRLGKVASKYLGKYQCKRIYYLTDDGLARWITSLIPKGISKDARKSINQSFNEIGVHLGITPQHGAVTITVGIELYGRIRENAQKRGLSIKKYLGEVVETSE